MNECVVFRQFESKLASVLENRTVRVPAKKEKDYAEGNYNPFFSLVDRDGKLLCVSTVAQKKPKKDTSGKEVGGDIEIVRFRDKEQGLVTDKKHPQSWESITKTVYDYFYTGKELLPSQI